MALLRSIVDQQTVAQFQNPTGVPRDVVLMGDQHNRHAGLIEFAEQFHQFSAGARVKRTGRFICQQERRIGDQGACNGDALLLPARQFPWTMILPMSQPDPFERDRRAFELFGAWDAATVCQRERNILQRRFARKQMKLLEDEADLFVAYRRKERRIEAFDRETVETVVTAG
jgi:hypothetical protein